MSEKIHTNLHRFYGHALVDGLNNAERVGWESEALQKLRISLLLEALPKGPTCLRVLDVGCGLGAAARLLAERGYTVEYVGMDLFPTMVEEARKTCSDLGWARFVAADFLMEDIDELAVLLGVPPNTRHDYFDLVICSGALSLVFDDPAQGWVFIDRLYRFARGACAFNVQSSVHLCSAPAALRHDFWHVDPADVLKHVRGLTNQVVLREDSIPSDAVFYLYRNADPALERARLTPLEKAEVYVQRNQYLRAREVLADAPVTARAVFLRGVSEAYTADLLVALVSLEEAHRLAVSDPDIIESIVHIAIVLGQIETGLQYVKLLPSSGSGADLRDDVRITLHGALSKHPDDRSDLAKNAETKFARAFMDATTAIERKDWEGAERQLDICVRERPHDGRPTALQARVDLEMHRHVSAFERAASVLAVQPDHHEAREIGLQSARLLGKLAKRGDTEARGLLLRYREHPVLGAIVGALIV